MFKNAHILFIFAHILFQNSFKKINNKYHGNT